MVPYSESVRKFIAPLKSAGWIRSRIEKEGLTERAIILCKLNKSLLESSISVGIHRKKEFVFLKEPLYLTNQ